MIQPDPLKAPPRWKDKPGPAMAVTIVDDLAYILLPGGQEAVIDAEYAELASKFRWHLLINPQRKGTFCQSQARVNGRRTTVLLHRLVLRNPPPSVRVRHIDGDGLNCRSVNLRQY